MSRFMVLNVWEVSDFASYVKPRWTKTFHGGTPVPMHKGWLNQKQGQQTWQASQHRKRHNEDKEDVVGSKVVGRQLSLTRWTSS